MMSNSYKSILTYVSCYMKLNYHIDGYTNNDSDTLGTMSYWASPPKQTSYRQNIRATAPVSV